MLVWVVVRWFWCSVVLMLCVWVIECVMVGGRVVCWGIVVLVVVLVVVVRVSRKVVEKWCGVIMNF